MRDYILEGEPVKAGTVVVSKAPSGGLKFDQDKPRMELLPSDLGCVLGLHTMSERLLEWYQGASHPTRMLYELIKDLRETCNVSALEIAQVLTFGAEKYSAWNWSKGMDWSRLVGAAVRHLEADHNGEELDPETGLRHVAHAACCIVFLASYSRGGVGNDDRVNYRTE